MTTSLVWVPAAQGHELALDGTALRCRKTGGRVLKSVPKAVLDSPLGEEFTALRERLMRHEEECRASVESWLLSGVPLPAALLAQVWPDPGWRGCLEHLVVRVGGRTGLLAEVTGEGRACIRGLGGGCEEPAVGPVLLVHPLLLDDLGPWRRILDERGAEQGVGQLSRQVHRRPEGSDPSASSLDDYAGGHFAELRQATARAAQYGFAIRGGSAVLPVAEDGVWVQARYWLGAGDPGQAVTTGRLLWVDAAERALPLGDVGPVAWSEGVRMAQLIYGGRTTDEQQ